MGWGYVRLSIDYEYDDSFDKGIRIKRVANPFSVYGDPFSQEADSSDWNQAHIVDYISKVEFRNKYKGAEEVDWDATGYTGLKMPWKGEDDEILICEAWSREQVDRPIYLLNDGRVVGKTEFEAAQEVMMMLGIYPVNERTAKSHKVTQRIMTGAEVIEETEWAGTYIPVIPIYGEEINVEGKRHFRGLIHDAKDPQRMLNYWRSTATELIALAPRVPFIGEERAFEAEPQKWATANSTSYPFIAVPNGAPLPQRQPIDPGNAVGAMSEALAASDDMKSIIGMYDASLGARSNETSGRAIMARQQEGDVATFHFIDNLSRGIRHIGCCLVDLIPKVYSSQRIVRVLGEDNKEQTVQLGQQPEGEEAQEAPEQEETGATKIDINRVYDLSVGKYDVAVTSGPSNTTRREQAAIQMTEFIRSYPDAVPLIGDIYAKAQDWPYADELAERFKKMLPPQIQGENPEVQQMQQQMQEMQGELERLQSEAEQLKAKNDIEMSKVKVAEHKAETDRLKELLPYMTPEMLASLGLQMSTQAMMTPDIAPGEQPMQPQEMPPEQPQMPPQDPMQEQSEMPPEMMPPEMAQ
jgi:hypothetical protein